MRVTSIAGLQALVGLGRFMEYFASTLAASLAKVAVGVGLALLGWGALASLLGYVAYPVVTLLASAYSLSTTYFTRSHGDPGGEEFLVSGVLSLLKLTYSNYPFIFSTQILNIA